MKRFVDLGKRVLGIFKRKDVSKDDKDKESNSIYSLRELEETFREVWEAMRPHVEKAMEAGKTAMEDPRAKRVVAGSAVLALLIVCYKSVSGSQDQYQPIKRKIPKVAPRPKTVPKLTLRVVRDVQWPVSRLIKQSPHSQYYSPY